MIDIWNRLITNITIAETGVCSNVTASETDTPAEFPCILVAIIDNRDDAVDLENSENGVRSFIRIQTFSNKSLAEARKIINIACDAMRQMGYRRTFGPREIENVHDRNVKRMEARFNRFVGDISDIPKFETPNQNNG